MNSNQIKGRWKNLSRLKKTLIIITGVFLLFATLIIAFISPITKYLVEKLDEKYTGRHITMDWAYVNPFTGYAHFSNFRIYEAKSDSLFFSVEGVNINISLLKLFSKTIELSEVSLDHPIVMIIQDKNALNFNDLIELFSSKGEDSTKLPLHFNMLNFKIKDGEFFYLENHTPIHYSIKNVQVESPGMRWNSDTIYAKISFSSGIGKGEVKGDFTINIQNLDYRYAVIVQKFDLDIIEQYLKELTNYGTFSAFLDANIKSKGNFKDKENVTTSGQLSISDFHFGKTPAEDYASFEQFKLVIHELSPKNRIYFYDSVTLTQPYFKYERYDQLDNIQTIFGNAGENITNSLADAGKFNLVIEIANYIKVLSRNFFQSHYKINHLEIVKGNLKFNDYSLSEKFSVDLNPLSITADSIDKENERANISFQSGIEPFGEVMADLSINPKDSGDFDIHYKLQKVPIAFFNPYTITYTSFPIDKGTLALNGTWNVRNGIIQSNNHLLLIDPRTTKRLKKKDVHWIPLPIIMAFVREKGNVIDYEIPISGNLADPKFHLHDVIFDILENIFVKPATTPYRMEVKTTEIEIEKSLSLSWEMRKSNLLPKQQAFLDKIAEFLSDNPDATIDIYPHQYTVKEKEYILLYESKKQYYLKKHNESDSALTETDITSIEKTSTKDSSFSRYLNKMVKDSLLFTIQDKCNILFGPEKVNHQLMQLMQEREQAFISCFSKRNVQGQVHIAKVENVIPYNGFSYYKIVYQGDIPKSLLKAYEKMNDLDEKAPRKQFKDDRQKSNSKLKS